MQYKGVIFRFFVVGSHKLRASDEIKQVFASAATYNKGFDEKFATSKTKNNNTRDMNLKWLTYLEIE